MNRIRDRAILLRIDNLTPTEEEKIVDGIRKLKKTKAPESRATLVQGETKKLPQKIRQIGFDD